MDPETDIETRTHAALSPRRASRAPWDPPSRPKKFSMLYRRASEGQGGLRGADVFGESDDDLGRGAD
jgi:hypothetical protein